MDSEDKALAKGFGVQSLSSSCQSTPERKGQSDDASKGEEILQDYLKLKKELIWTCSDKERKQFSPSKCKSDKRIKGCKNSDLRKASLSLPILNQNQASRKQQRKGENPVRILSHTEVAPDAVSSNSWICKNSACRATLTLDDTFCKRCSCCICHLFDDNKDPSLWLVCTSESYEPESCGSSCHIECALQRGKVGVVDLGQLMQLDGSYCCASCGKVSGILGCWRKQLVIAKDARRVDVLCHRISLSYRLLDGTSRFRELHEVVVDAKAKLETEVGPVNGVSAKMARGIVSRLSVSGDVLKLCSLAIEKADLRLGTMSDANPPQRDSLPAACRFQFEEVTSSSLAIVLKEFSSASSNDIKGYKLWYSESREEFQPEEPICIFPRDQRRILVSNLQPCTEYTFRIISYTESGDLGHSESKCFTKSKEIIHKNSEAAASIDRKMDNLDFDGSSSCKRESKFAEAVESSGFKVRDLGKVLRIAWAEEGSYDEYCSVDGDDECCGRNSAMKPESADEEDQLPFASRKLDLNVSSVPDLNADVTPPAEFSRDEDNGCSSEQLVEAEEDIVSPGTLKNGMLRSNGSGNSQSHFVRPLREVPAVESRTRLCGKHAQTPTSNEDAYDCDSTLINGSPLWFSSGSNHLDGSYEYCVKIIRWLECGGHIEQEFRMKFLTWFSLRSTEQERRVVHTFIHTLIDDPSSLAGQLVDSFLDIISSKRPRNGFCSKLWH
ncbi:hypothetical protein Syun_011273 [Stephania yunnanensis]|uniref:Fibronectin type-III domain-containing protein n=1 Tax=Stephania yunnanensis TaxID=152371 RepID=A0AAP0JYG8_9MAGN